jgi:AhpD family alkylhydroperoxidase
MSSMIDDKIRELIAIGASIGANCVPCLRYHYSYAFELGVSLEDIQQAIEIGKMVREQPRKHIDEEIPELQKRYQK